MVAAHATVPEAGGDCTWPLISGYGHGNTAVTRRGRPSRPGWPHRCQRLPNLRSRTFRCTCRALSPYQPFGCAFGARSALGAARLASRTCASIVVRLNAAALKAIVSPVIHRIRSTRLVSRRPIHDRTPTDCVPRAREPGPPESRWPLERRRKGTAAGVIYRLRAGPGPWVVGDADCGRLPWWRGDGPVVGPGRRPPGLLVCLVAGDTGESAQGHLFAGARLLGIGQAHHPERVEQPDQTGEDRDEQGHLQGERAGPRC